MEKLVICSHSVEVLAGFGATISTDSLCWPAEVPPTGVVSHTERPPTPWGGIPLSGGLPGKLLPSGPYPGGNSLSPDVWDHTIYSQSGRASNPQPNSVGLGELDSILCCSRKPV